MHASKFSFNHPPPSLLITVHHATVHKSMLAINSNSSDSTQISCLGTLMASLLLIVAL